QRPSLLRPCLLQQLVELGLDAGETLAVGELGGLGAGDYDEVVASGQTLLGLPKSLPEQALYLVALDRAADLAANGQPQAGVGVDIALARERVEHEMAAGMRAALPVDAIELSAAGHATAPGSGHR